MNKDDKNWCGLQYNPHLTAGSERTTKQNITQTLDEIEAIPDEHGELAKQKSWEFVRNYASAIRHLCRK